jgi:hypothetical protein
MVSTAGNVPPGIVLKGGKKRTVKKQSLRKRATRKRRTANY